MSKRCPGRAWDTEKPRPSSGKGLTFPSTAPLLGPTVAARRTADLTMVRVKGLVVQEKGRTTTIQGTVRLPTWLAHHIRDVLNATGHARASAHAFRETVATLVRNPERGSHRDERP